MDRLGYEGKMVGRLTILLQFYLWTSIDFKGIIKTKKKEKREESKFIINYRNINYRNMWKKICYKGIFIEYV